MTLELVEEGKEHIKREKRRIQRMKESASRRRDFADRFGSTGDFGGDSSDHYQPRLRGQVATHEQRQRNLCKEIIFAFYPG